MENTIMNKQDTYIIDEDVIEQAEDIVERALKSALDISTETATILSMTPRDGYQKKLYLISQADDMSTKEKLDAINAAENKYAKDLEKNTEVCKELAMIKVGLFFSCVAGTVFLMSTPKGKQIGKFILQSVT